MTDILEEPPDENEQYESLDESLGDDDLPGPGGPRETDGGRNVDVELIVDQTELREAGADLDDPESLAVLDGGMDDPDGVERRAPGDDYEAGWDVDPVPNDHSDASPG
jgi:hypothetical protein